MKKLFLLFSLAVGFIACEADEIFDLNQEVVALSGQLDQETKDRIAADAENFETLQALINEVVENQAVINEAFEAADAALAEAIAAEEAARKAGDLAQAEALAAETAARQQDVADLEAEIAEQVTKLTGLIVTNANAIVALDTALTAEREARIAQDSILTAKVKTNLSFILSNARAISQEVADRKAAIADLQSQLDEAKEELQAAIDANADNIEDLQGAVESLESQVAINVDAIDVAEERLRKIEIEMMWAAEALDGIDGVDDHQVVEDDEWKQAHLLLSEGIREVIEAVQEAQANIISNDTDILNLQSDVASNTFNIESLDAELQILAGQVSDVLTDYVTEGELNDAIADFVTLAEVNADLADDFAKALQDAKDYADANDDVQTDAEINQLISDALAALESQDVSNIQAAVNALEDAVYSSIVVNFEFGGEIIASLVSNTLSPNSIPNLESIIDVSELIGDNYAFNKSQAKSSGGGLSGGWGFKDSASGQATATIYFTTNDKIGINEDYVFSFDLDGHVEEFETDSDLIDNYFNSLAISSAQPGSPANSSTCGYRAITFFSDESAPEGMSDAEILEVKSSDVTLTATSSSTWITDGGTIALSYAKVQLNGETPDCGAWNEAETVYYATIGYTTAATFKFRVTLNGEEYIRDVPVTDISTNAAVGGSKLIMKRPSQS